MFSLDVGLQLIKDYKILKGIKYPYLFEILNNQPFKVNRKKEYFNVNQSLLYIAINILCFFIYTFVRVSMEHNI